MRRGEIYLVKSKRGNDPKKQRPYVIVSRRLFVDCKHSTVICAPIRTKINDINTEVVIGINEGLKHHCAIKCDELLSIPRNELTDVKGSLGYTKMAELDAALQIAISP